MLDAFETLTAADADRLARLHESTLPTSVFGRTGVRLLTRYYHWAASSPAEHLFVVQIGRAHV